MSVLSHGRDVFNRRSLLCLNLARLISRIETTPSYGVEEGVLLKPKITTAVFRLCMNVYVGRRRWK